MVCKWVRIGSYLVAPVYAYPVSIGHAIDIAKEHGCELPTPALVDQIWKAADLRIEPLTREHNGTIAQMASREVFADQERRINEAIGTQMFTLLAGTHKDVVRCPNTGRVGLYGWHRLNGKPIQGPYYGHALGWVDYSQGVRLVKKG